jgi:hypothetical protein
VLAILGVMGIALVGGVWYVGHKVKQAVVKTANTYGVDLHSLPVSTAGSSARPAKVHKVCDLLTAQEVSQLIGEPIDHVGPVEQACGYFGPPGLSAKLDQDLRSGLAQQALPGGTTNGGDITKMLQKMQDTSAGMQLQPGQEMPLLMIAVDPDGKAQMTAMAIAKGIFGGISNASEAKGGIDVGKDVPGLGDRAVRMPKMGLNVLQGETLIRIMPAPFPDADAKCIAVARAALAKL